ncbi:MAG: bifunctional diaminohydroxyphosphoribosylaminopyrimidine deaminase/5-amino-6-(5-phosphoribosylamino)uracil reductase RibD, partial [Elusimicrobia bacterium]|nr:bifunctional diaminohydroxyphosphoribosylaminopyrimidine deaminase/5-amino-6-(5-phosphoribosylamino)uracil reductase RibD [Elusimicrobiota bacterium]
FMRRALALARRGIPEASPNPFVGCVLVKGGRVVGEGWHARYGEAHAEPQALRRAGRRARGATAYVTLEPCCHTAKKTPPCCPALIAAGIKRVVAGCLDPNPPVSGRGLRQLRAAGIRAELGPLREECSALTRPFAVRLKKRRPYVILKAAASLDGRTQDVRGRSKWITSPEARREGHRLRASVDAILVGIGTVLADDPSLTAHGRGREPLRVVLDSRLRIPPKARVLRGDAATVVFCARKDERKGPRRGTAVVRRVARRAGGLDLREVLAALLELGVGTVLVEGGPRVHAAFLEAGLVDEVRWFLAPALLDGLPLSEARRLRNASVFPVGPDFVVSGFLDTLTSTKTTAGRKIL